MCDDVWCVIVIVICDEWYGMWHMICDEWYVTYDMWWVIWDVTWYVTMIWDEWYVICDMGCDILWYGMWHMTYVMSDIWYVICDEWWVICDIHLCDVIVMSDMGCDIRHMMSDMIVTLIYDMSDYDVWWVTMVYGDMYVIGVYDYTSYIICNWGESIRIGNKLIWVRKSFLETCDKALSSFKWNAELSAMLCWLGPAVCFVPFSNGQITFRQGREDLRLK